jgi:hypothetical protein
MTQLLGLPLDGKEEEIRLLLQKQVSKASIARIVGVARPTIYFTGLSKHGSCRLGDYADRKT